MTLNGTRFGAIQFTPREVVFFSEGLIGFEDLHDFVQVPHGEDFCWLQSIREPELAFLCAFTDSVCPDYSPELNPFVQIALDLTPDTERFMLATASIPGGKPDEMTLNLAAPIVVNAYSRHALQCVVENEAYTVRHRIFPEAKKAYKLAA